MKIINVKPIITCYTEPSWDNVHLSFIYRFDLETDIDLLEDLKIHPYGPQLPNRTLYTSTKFQHKIDEFKQSMMQCAKELLLNTDEGKNIKGIWWWLNNDNFDNICEAGAYINKDTKGFSMSRHIDNASILANFIVNLKDNESSTVFVDYKDPYVTLYQAEKKKYTGVIFFNTGGTPHKIDVVDDERYMMLGSILLYKNL